MPNLYRRLPSVDRLLQDERLADVLASRPRPYVVEAARDALDDARRAIAAGGEVGDLVGATRQRLEDAIALPLRRAINAAGVIVHTNLGRAPLSPSALAAMQEVGAGYSNLEFDLEAGSRGSRHEHVTGLLRRLTGAEDALVVNNNAAAMLLALAGLGQGREVIISRGELVEIGDGSSAVGGGSLPGETLPTRVLLAPRRLGAVQFAVALRKQRPAVVGRIERDRLVLDLRTVLPEEDATLIGVLRPLLRDTSAGDGSCAS